MSIVIKEVENKADLKKFVSFYTHLYRKNKQVAYPLHFDEIDTLKKGKNPSHDFCLSKYWLAYKDNKVVGRIAAIINGKEQAKFEIPIGRFGWYDFIDDKEVSSSLMETAIAWLKKHEVTELHGPMGFTDMDQEGMLVEGFDFPNTMITIYNYAYYLDHYDHMGFQKSADWVEFELKPREGNEALINQLAERTGRTYNLQSKYFKSRKQLKTRAQEVFGLLNRCYSHLYGFIPTNQEQIDFYTEAYLSFVRLDLISVIEDENGQIVGVGIVMPSFTKALQMAKGKLFPFGIFGLIKAFFKNDRMDLLLVAVDHDYKGKGVTSMIMRDVMIGVHKLGIDFAETNPELEGNHQVQSMWRLFPSRQTKRRRCYIRAIDVGGVVKYKGIES